MEKKIISRKLLAGLNFLEAITFFFLFIAILIPFTYDALAVVGENNVTVKTLLQVGAVAPEILSITINDGAAGIDLTANSTTLVNVYIIARDFNGEDNIDNVTAEFFDNSASFYGDADDNNYHYTNNSCTINLSYGDIYEVSANCTFEVEYYANNATWNATVLVTDNTSRTDLESNTTTINTLLALALPDSIDYGTVNATEVSLEQIANVTNMGNVMMNLSLSGYAVSEGDGLAMNCTLGSIKNISIDYEKYNLTASNPGELTLSEFEVNYTNLTSNSVTEKFNLDYRRNDTSAYIDDTNATYWRIYVPVGVAGTCTGNIVFGAVQS